MLVEKREDLCIDLFAGWADHNAGEPVPCVHDSAGGPEQRDPMSSRRAAPDANALGIDAVILRVRAQIADRGLAVGYLGGIDSFVGKAVFGVLSYCQSSWGYSERGGRW